jgi:hypothetical protein
MTPVEKTFAQFSDTESLCGRNHTIHTQNHTELHLNSLFIPLSLPSVRGVAASAALSVRVPHRACVHPLPRLQVLLHPGKRLTEEHPLQGPGLQSVS